MGARLSKSKNDECCACVPHVAVRSTEMRLNSNRRCLAVRAKISVYTSYKRKLVKGHIHMLNVCVVCVCARVRVCTSIHHTDTDIRRRTNVDFLHFPSPCNV
jgi:hypothetical protein